MIICIKCNIEQSSDNFWKSKQNKNGLHSYCKSCLKECVKIYNKKFFKTEKGKKTRAKTWKKYASKPEVRKRRNELKRLRKEGTEYIRNRRRNDPIFKLKDSLRRRLSLFLKYKGLKKVYKFSQYIGCTQHELKEHLEKQFESGMSWDNHGKWHIDHIIPLSSAKSEEKIYKLCHYTNLQPLWAFDNISKGSKIIEAYK